MTKKKFYITTAIDYPNSKPHIGHAYEKIIADVLARWHRLKGEDVFFLTGTDEHGQKIYKTAKEKGKDPKEFVDEMVPYFKQLCEKLNISCTRFIRTTEEEHKKTCQEVFKKLEKKGDIYKGSYEGMYCSGCEAYYTERELENGLCPVHKKKPEIVKEDTYFFRLSNYQDQLIKHIQQRPSFIQPESKRKEILNRLEEPLKDLSVSRTSFDWGVKVPGDKSHVLYVWLDALLNYITGIDYPGEKFKKYWPADVHIIGKDINWFHTVIWPCELMSAGIKLPKTVQIHGFVNLGGEKLSKSRGITVDPIKLAEEYGTDPIRYFFIKEIPAGEDGNFSYEALTERTNSDLADDLGNLMQRTMVLIHKNFQGKIPSPKKFEREEQELIKESDIFEETDKLMQKCQWHKAISRIWSFIRMCNKYINETEPWKRKNEPNRLATILYTLAESLRVIAIYTKPFMPQTADKITEQLGQDKENFGQIKFRKTTKGTLEKPEILFKKKEIKTQDPFSKLSLRIGKITQAKPHPSADRLYILKVSLGRETRQLVAGLKPYFTEKELKGKHIVVLTNLKPAKLKGIESTGMLLAAEYKDKVVLLESPNSKPGDPVYIEGIKPIGMQITLKDFEKISITTKNQKAYYQGKYLKTSKEEIQAETEDGAKVC